MELAGKPWHDGGSRWYLIYKVDGLRTTARQQMRPREQTTDGLWCRQRLPFV